MFSKFYVKSKQNKLNDLDKKIQEYRLNIKKLEKDKIYKEKELKNVKLEGENLTKKYKSIFRIIQERGINIKVLKKEHNIREWDNLYLSKSGEMINILFKGDKIIKTFSKEESCEISRILRKRKYSLVVTRIEGNVINIVFRII